MKQPEDEVTGDLYEAEWRDGFAAASERDENGDLVARPNPHPEGTPQRLEWGNGWFHGVKKRAGRPKVHANAAARQAAWRARHQLGQLTVQLPADVLEGLDAYKARTMMNRDADVTLSGVITHLVRTQLMRKR